MALKLAEQPKRFWKPCEPNYYKFKYPTLRRHSSLIRTPNKVNPPWWVAFKAKSLRSLRSERWGGRLHTHRYSRSHIVIIINTWPFYMNHAFWSWNWREQQQQQQQQRNTIFIRCRHFNDGTADDLKDHNSGKKFKELNCKLWNQKMLRVERLRD